jgi:hypothetical protein
MLSYWGGMKVTLRGIALFVTLMAAMFLIPGGVPGIAGAAVVEGISLAETIDVGDGGPSLVLNGAGVRKKLVVKVYVAALYLENRRKTTLEILDDEGRKRVVMHSLRETVKAKSLAKAWDDGFHKNQSPSVMAALEERLRKFKGFFPDVHRGDLIEIDIIPDVGTVVRLNSVERGKVEGQDFSRALLEVWLGKSPADKGLKKAFLGE